MRLSKIIVVVVLVVAGLAVLGVGLAFAQLAPRTPWGGSGHMGMMNGRHGMMGNGGGMMGDPELMDKMHEWMSQEGGMHETVWSALAEALGLPQEELEAKVANGQTIAQIAEEKGFVLAELADRLEAAHREALDKAVADGILTQEQADEMLDHMVGKYEWMLTHLGSHMSSGIGPGSGGCHGDTPSDNNSTSTQG